MKKPELRKTSTRSLLRVYPCKSMSCLIAVVVLLPVTYCVMIDARQSFFELKSKCFFFFRGASGGGEGRGEGVHPAQKLNTSA